MGARYQALIQGFTPRRVPYAAPNLPAIALDENDSAALLAISVERFRDEVAAGVLPRPRKIDTLRRWYRPDLERYVGWVYVGLFDGYVKIGWSRNVPGRFRALQEGLPNELWLLATFIGSQSDERVLHRAFDAQRSRGEWFRLEGALAAWIDAGCPL